MEAEQVRQLQKELDDETKNAIYKRQDEIAKMNRLIAENEKHKSMREQEMLREREEEVEAQKKYIEVLDKQEHDRAIEIKKREERLANHGAMNEQFTKMQTKKYHEIDEEKVFKRNRELHECAEM